MSQFYEDGGNSPMSRQRDLVLSANEFCFLQNKTNGTIKTYTGPITMTISQQESLVIFNPKTKRFEETQDFDKARQLFVSAPEGWYTVLKNPSIDNTYPELAKAVISSELQIGKKINISGPCSFSLFPGQMAKVIRGHRLRSNQYLLARVYDAEAAEREISSATIIDAEGKEIAKKTEKYFVGQLLVIKGTEISFYIPPTGIEVIAVDGKNEYVRDAITLERLEYAILKDEDGEKRYVHGPAVVFPKPTETFVETPKGGNIFRALELSPISGIYVKVIAEYTDKDKDGKEIKHPIGEELFITGNEQMIYYPRPEHAMIQYDGKYMHHAIAIPEGEGRYVLNRLTGVITTVKGPKMYLPDPRKEVIVMRKLSPSECELMYPGNKEVLAHNVELTEQAIERLARKGLNKDAVVTDALNLMYSTQNQEKSLAIFEANANISRGVSYTKPRTITLDTKYDGVVSIDVWTGYAVNVISKTGNREIVIGPITRLLDYNETLEAIELSTGSPKTTDNTIKTAYLRIENNRVSDIIYAQTKDFVEVQIKVSYCVDFLEEYKKKWFSIENYVKYLCDRERSLLKKEIKKYNIEDFYINATDIVRSVLLNIPKNPSKETSKYNGRLFKENGMLVKDVEVLNISVESEIAKILNQHQTEMIEKTLELSDAEKNAETAKKLAEYEKQKIELKHNNKIYEHELNQAYKLELLKAELEIQEKTMEKEKASTQAKSDLQNIIDAIEKAQLERAKAKDAAKIETEKKLAEIEKEKQEAYANTVADIMKSIDSNLAAALTSNANAEIFSAISQAIAPYAIANGNESIADVINKILRGTSLEEAVKNLTNFRIE